MPKGKRSRQFSPTLTDADGAIICKKFVMRKLDPIEWTDNDVGCAA
jgi:hypothetical protein